MQIRQLLERVRAVLLDPDAVRWTDAELLMWFNDARRELAILRPREFSKRWIMPLVRGVMQSAPLECEAVIKATVNIAANGAMGRGITQVELELMQLSHPDWAVEAVYPFRPEVRQFATDPNDPRVFFVWPGNDGNGRVELQGVQLPVDATSTGEGIGCRAVFANALADYVLYRAFSKDGDSPEAAQRAAGHYSAFATALGAKAATEAS